MIVPLVKEIIFDKFEYKTHFRAFENASFVTRRKLYVQEQTGYPKLYGVRYIEYT